MPVPIRDDGTRRSITTMLRGVTIERGAACVYCGKPEYVSEFPATRQLGANR